MKRRVFYATVLAAIPALLSGFLLLRFFVEVPFWDQWWLVPLLAAQREGKLELWMLWHQHYEHRIFVPKLVMLALASFSRWNLHYEVAVNWLLTCFSVGGSFWYLCRVARLGRLREWPLLTTAVSFVLFSPAPFDNWLWSWQMPYFIVVASAVIATLLLGRFVFSRWRFIWACVLATVATLSFGTGALVWVIGAYVIARSFRRRQRLRILGIWGATSVVVIYVLLIGYEFSANRGGEAVKTVLEGASYILQYLGSGVIPYSNKSLTIAAGLAFFVLVVSISCLERQLFARKRLALAPFFSWPVFAILSAFLTVSGRSTFHPRYIAYAEIGWLGVFLLLIVFSRELRLSSFLRRICTILTVLLALLLTQMWGFGIASMRWFSSEMDANREIVLNSSDPARLKRVYGTPEHLESEFRPILRKYKLCLFRSQTNAPNMNSSK